MQKKQKKSNFSKSSKNSTKEQRELQIFKRDMAQFKQTRSRLTGKIEYNTGVPLINNIYSYTQTGVMQQQPFNYRHILNTYIKNSPETLLVLNSVITDIVSDGYVFEAIEDYSGKKEKDPETGKKSYSVKKTNIRKAEEYCKKNFFIRELKAGLFDGLWSGNLSIWFRPDENSTKDKIKQIIDIHNKAHIQVKEALVSKEDTLRLIKNLPNGYPKIEQKEMKEYYDEEFNKLMTFKHVPWSTISMLTDNISVLAFAQAVSTSGPIVDASGQPIEGKYNASGILQRVWPASQILHWKYMSWDGKPWGYSPILGSMPVISILIMLKDYAGRWFEQGGTPESILMFKRAGLNDANVKKFEQVLQTFQKAYNKRGIYVGTAPDDFEKIDLNNWNKDMEYKTLAVYCTSIIASVFQIPLARLQGLLGLEIKGSPSDAADSAYWRTISEIQNSIETLLNSQLFEPYFKVRIKFNNSYIQDDIRIQQKRMQKFDALAKQLDLLARKGKSMKIDALLTIINGEDVPLDEDMLEEDPEAKMMGLAGNRQGFESNQDLMGTNKQKSKDKTTEQLDKQEESRIRNDLKEIKELMNKVLDEDRLAINEARKEVIKQAKEKLQKK